jgi:hypothetical protein
MILAFCGKFWEKSAIRCMMEKIFDVIVLGAGERAILSDIAALGSTSSRSLRLERCQDLPGM